MDPSQIDRNTDTIQLLLGAITALAAVVVTLWLDSRYLRKMIIEQSVEATKGMVLMTAALQENTRIISENTQAQRDMRDLMIHFFMDEKLPFPPKRSG